MEQIRTNDDDTAVYLSSGA